MIKLAKPQKTVRGQVYIWESDSSNPHGGFVTKAIVDLLRIDVTIDDQTKLSGQHVVIENAGEVYNKDKESGSLLPGFMESAQPDMDGNFIFEPHNGGGRMDNEPTLATYRQRKNLEAAHFGEVNAYFHIDKMAHYIDNLLSSLGERSLPRVKAVVNAHPAVIEKNGVRDGVRGKASGKWLPFQGGHYRLSGHKLTAIPEVKTISPAGEIHLGPGWRLTNDGALPAAYGHKYRSNASHNSGIIYHEYGHHINRHTADFTVNRLYAPHRQDNRKTASDEGLSDYWAATMMNSPHIWALHRRHIEPDIHPRSLVSKKTMADFDTSPEADPHTNGTILAATLWDIRQVFCQDNPIGYQDFDKILLKALILIGLQHDDTFNPTPKGTSRVRSGFGIVFSALLAADNFCFGGINSDRIRQGFHRRGIQYIEPQNISDKSHSLSLNKADPRKLKSSIAHILKRDPEAIIPDEDELITRDQLESDLTAAGAPPFAFTMVGDIMLGSRMNRPISDFGPEYPFHSVYPILRRSNIVKGNLEGPFAAESPQKNRRYSYKVNPKNARILRRAGFHVMTMANNHLLDCGREGVLETIAALKKHGIRSSGAGINEPSAHAPVILRSGKHKIGILSYYWNRRTAATASRPGSAMDTPEWVSRDIANLKPQVDKVIVTVHWGVPYERVPAPEDRLKAQFAIDCGADAVMGHHPHIIQPFELYKKRPIIYSLGNFAFGSGNSQAESILAAFRFTEAATEITLFPVYIKNRDPRIHYQPKIMIGKAAFKTIQRMKSISGHHSEQIIFKNNTGQITLPD